jgi:SagB-type dehydrogenase family enzyme
MTGVDMLDFLKDLDGRNVEECLEAYRAARRRAEEERRAQFAMFGLPTGLSCPASLLYHLDSRYCPDTELPLSDEEAAALVRTFDYKCYPGATRIALPAHLPPLDVPLEEAIRERRSRNEFSGAPIHVEELSKLLALAGGVTHMGEIPRRAAPSAGALYPVEIYPWVFLVDHVPPALYHYVPLQHTLESVKPLDGWKDLWPMLDEGCQGCTPAIAFVLTASLPRVQAKYGERGYRFALMESGHIAQNFLLAAAALRLNALPAGGFFDAGVTFLLGIDGEQEVTAYVILVGKP